MHFENVSQNRKWRIEAQYPSRGEERPFKKGLYQLATLQLPEIFWLASRLHPPVSGLSNA